MKVKTSMCTSGQQKYLYLADSETQFPTFSTTDRYIADLALSAIPRGFYINMEI